jgi:hypothetical protein
MTMSMLVLHIGLHKTGSTSIQDSLQGYSAERIKYLALGPANHSVAIRTAFTDSPHPEKDGMHARLGRTAEGVARMREDIIARMNTQLSSREFDKFVISGEGITQLSVAALQELKSMLLKYVDAIQVFAYVRDPAGFAISDYQQRVKTGYAGYDLAKPNYRGRLEKFLLVFGRENFSAKKFDRNSLKDGSVVMDFCEAWSIPFDRDKEVRANESLSPEVVRLVHLFNRQGVPSKGSPQLTKGRQMLIRSLAEHFPGRFTLPERFRAAAFDEEDMEWLRRELGISFQVERPDAATAGGEFRNLVESIDEGTVDSYRAFLRQSKIPIHAGDGTIDLLNRHYQTCVASVDTVKDRLSRILKRGKKGSVGV